MKKIFYNDPDETPLEEIIAVDPKLTGLLPAEVTDFINQITDET